MTLAARLAEQADRLGGKCFFHHGGVDQLRDRATAKEQRGCAAI
jgi:hypothetical protein